MDNNQYDINTETASAVDVKNKVLVPVSLILGFLVFYLILMLISFLPSGDATDYFIGILDPFLTIGLFFLFLWLYPIFDKSNQFQTGLTRRNFEQLYLGSFDGRKTKFFLFLFLFKVSFFIINYIHTFQSKDSGFILRSYLSIEYVLYNIPLFLISYIVFSNKIPFIQNYFYRLKTRLGLFTTMTLVVYSIVTLGNCTPHQKKDSPPIWILLLLTKDKVLSSITLSIQSITLDNGTTVGSQNANSVGVNYSIQLKSTANYSNGTSADITKSSVWNSSNNQIASVNAQGTVATYSFGSTIINSGFGGMSENISISVKDSISSIYIAPQGLLLGKNSSYTMKAYSATTNTEITSNISWSSSDPTVATVDNFGKVTALKNGSVVITVSYKDSSNNTISEKTSITIKDFILAGEEISSSLTNLHFQARKPLDRNLSISTYSTEGDCGFGYACITANRTDFFYKHIAVDYHAGHNSGYLSLLSNYGTVDNISQADSFNMGNRVVVSHLLKNLQNWVTVYAHLNSIPIIINSLVGSNSSRVNKGMVLGEIGYSGTDTTPLSANNRHLHFEMKKYGIGEHIPFYSKEKNIIFVNFFCYQ